MKLESIKPIIAIILNVLAMALLTLLFAAVILILFTRPANAETITVTETNFGDLVVSHPDEPFTITTSCDSISVTPTPYTSIYIDASHSDDPLVDQQILDVYSSSTVTMSLPRMPKWSWTVVVVVNNDSQVSQRRGTIECSSPPTTTTTPVTTTTVATTLPPTTTTTTSTPSSTTPTTTTEIAENSSSTNTTGETTQSTGTTRSKSPMTESGSANQQVATAPPTTPTEPIVSCTADPCFSIGVNIVYVVIGVWG